MLYDPEKQEHRRQLAQEIIDLMHYAEFKFEDTKGEFVYSRQVNPQIKVMVYTSIVNGEVREKDADAIRVTGVYTTFAGDERGIVKSERVYRTGELEAIVERVLQRMRNVWRKTKQVEHCKSCGAPKFVSKKGHLVCCEACWTKQAAS